MNPNHKTKDSIMIDARTKAWEDFRNYQYNRIHDIKISDKYAKFAYEKGWSAAMKEAYKVLVIDDWGEDGYDTIQKHRKAVRQRLGLEK